MYLKCYKKNGLEWFHFTFQYLDVSIILILTAFVHHPLTYKYSMHAVHLLSLSW